MCWGREKLATKVGWKAVSLEESSGFGGLTGTRQAVEKACAKRKDAGDRDATQRLQRR